MKCGDHVSPAFLASLASLPTNAPYCASIATAASASSASIWSVASSQSSDDSSSSAQSSDTESCDSLCQAHPHPSKPSSHPSDRFSEQPIKFTSPWTRQPVQCGASTVTDAVLPELRRNPRRTSSSSTSRTGCPPALVRQSDRKVNFVDSLVDSSTQIVETIWPLSSVVCRSELGSKGVLPLRTFIQETLRRSRTSYSTLQVALYYLILIKPHVPKHDFTMEQPDDLHSSRVLQCGRRMFLAALILASKYLQDRNYSARAWSKISGLNTQEINQNEMAFLIAVGWKLHITEDVFQRWTDIVLKYTPPPNPPSPRSALSQRTYDQQTLDWKHVIMRLNPELDNVDGILPPSTSGSGSRPRSKSRDFPSALSPRSILPFPQDRIGTFGSDSGCDGAPTPRAAPATGGHPTPFILEPPTTVYTTPGRLAPSLGMLPTPRLTPQPSGFSTPAVSAASYLLGGGGGGGHKTSSMSMALSAASTTGQQQQQLLDRFPFSSAITASPQGYFPARRSSLANSISTASSPESMVSDSSRTSRSSSISSASSSTLAPPAPFVKLDVQARCRSAKMLMCTERMGLLRPSMTITPTILASSAAVADDFHAQEHYLTSSPEPYSGQMGGKSLLHPHLQAYDNTPLARRASDADESAARALQDLHNYRGGELTATQQQQQQQQQPTVTVTAPSVTRKRSRPLSIDHSAVLHDNVRHLLGRSSTDLATAQGGAWSNGLVHASRRGSALAAAAASSDHHRASVKRVCCSTEAATEELYHPSMSGYAGPGMWANILN